MLIHVTFGSDHKHKIGLHDIDHNVVVAIRCKDHNEGRDKAFQLFGRKFCTTYPTRPDLRYYPRGIIEINA